MEYKEAIDALEKSGEYRDWRKQSPDAYLTHAFIMVDPTIKEEWQIGYYDVGKDMVTTFSVSDEVMKNPEAEAFKDGGKIAMLDLSKVKVSLDKAMQTADKTQKEKYSSHTPYKKIVILQHLDLGQVWNITFVTNTFKTLNIKVDAKTGKVVKDELVDLFRIEK